MRLSDSFILIPIIGVAAATFVEGWIVVAGVAIWAALYFGACSLMEWLSRRGRRLERGEEDRIRKVLANDPEYLKAVKAERGLRPEKYGVDDAAIRTGD